MVNGIVRTFAVVILVVGAMLVMMSIPDLGDSDRVRIFGCLFGLVGAGIGLVLIRATGRPVRS